MKALPFLFVLMLLASACRDKAPGPVAETPEAGPQWIQLFNGHDMTGWTPKFRGQALGENYKNTFRVEDGILKVSYDQYSTCREEFGHLFYQTPYSHYRLRAEYRFVGAQVPDGPDWAFHNGPPDGTSHPYTAVPAAPNWLDAIAVLNDIGAKVLGFSSNGGDSGTNTAHRDLEQTAIATGAVLSDGTPLVWALDTSGTGLDFAVVDAIEDLSTQVARDVTTAVEESPIVDDGIDAADFITSVVPLSADPTVGIDSMDETTFYGVEAGTMLTFTVTFQNDIVEEELEPQVFVARIVVLGDNTVRLDDRRVIILIPPSDIPMG